MCYLAYSRIACISSDVDTFFSLEYFCVHQGDAAPGRSLPLCVLPLGPPAGRRRGCGLAPRRAQPAPLLRLAAAGHLRPQKVRPSPLVPFPEFEIRRSE
jgi:hypothetical protein